MMIKFLFLILFANLASQADTAAPAQDDGLLPLERDQLQKEQKIDNRIKIFTAASIRLHKAFDSAVGNKQFEGVPLGLQVWMNLLASSLNDIDANAGWKKKSKALIAYEIHLRKSIKEVNNYKIKAPLDQQDYLETWLAQAEKIRSRFIDILFFGK
jgi:hypothetical protein